MTLAAGRPYLAIPGPSVMPDRVLAAMHRAAPNIYTGELIDITASLVPDLKRLAGTKHHCAMYITNGHGTWEATVANIFSPGDVALVLATGGFALGWGAVAARMGVECQIIDFGRRSSIDPVQVAKALTADTSHKIKAVLAVQTDTSTSIRNDIAALRSAIDATGHPALLMIDCVCSLGCERFLMDDWGVDVMISASQKGLMTPPGMGFVFFNDKAAKFHSNAKCNTHYWDWKPRANPDEFWQYWDGTAPTHHVFALREAVNMIFEEGLENVWTRHGRLARAYHAAVQAWGQGGSMELNVADPAKRSHAVTSIRIDAPHGAALRNWLTGNTGVTLGVGLGMSTAADPKAEGFFRIGHMGHVNAHMVLGVIGSIQLGLNALGIAHGKGAMDAAVAALHSQ
jgi:alanine-glyoxylate transaminase / serine-glyoxylate transaminase / serine-pyruvate transaminase